MKFRTLGKTGLVISEIGFGCQSIGGGLYYKNEDESLKTLNMAFELGVNFFDTSDHYSLGESEKLVGKAFKGKRDKIIIGTKAGTLYSPATGFLLRKRGWIRPLSRYLTGMKIPLHLIRAKQKYSDFSKSYLFSAVEKSLRRLQTDYIDLFQLHKPSRAVLERGEFIETLEELKKEGKIRHYGISCADNRDAFFCFKYPGIASVQLTINLLHKNLVEEILPEAAERGVAVIGRNPRAQGHLTAELSDIMAETYARSSRELIEKSKRAESYMFLAKPGRTLAQAALQFVLSFPQVSAVIPRAVNRIQLEEIINALNSPSFSSNEWEMINSKPETAAE